MSGDGYRVWFWNHGAHSVTADAEHVDEVAARLRAEGFFVWVTPEVEIHMGPPPHPRA